jgi:phosphohistidine phosphatase
VLADLPDDFQRVMVVGHNPAMEELTTLLTGEAVPLPTAALVLVTLPIDRWRELEEDPVGKLVNFWRPEKY